jgi:integrase
VAEAKLVEQRKAVQDGKDPKAIKRISKHSFSELATDYKAWAGRQSAFSSKKYFIERLEKTLGCVPLRMFTTRMVEEMQTKMLADGLKPATVNRHMATLKHMFTKAVEWEMADDESLKRVRRVKQLKENNRRLRFLSAEECRALIKQCSPHLLPIVIMAIHTGMRREEIFSLEWDKHVDLRHGFILLDKTKNGDRREIPINKTLRKTLRSIIRRVDSPYVFHDDDGKRVKDVRTAFHGACRRAGIKDFRFHDLRHTFASQMIMNGADLMTVKELLGHKTLTMTLRYSHLAQSHKANALMALEKALNGGSSIQKLYNRPKSTVSGKNVTPPLTTEVRSGIMVFPHARP